MATQLEPAPDAILVPALDDAAMTSVEDVQVVAQPGEWWGDPQVLSVLSPVVVSITNNGSAPLRIEYRHIELSSDSGQRFSALPPFEVGGPVHAPVLVGAHRPLEAGFEHRGFGIAPYLAPLYPGVPVASQPFITDKRYHARTFAEWRAAGGGLPTSEIRTLALPEGVLMPGGWVGGYVYFTALPRDTERVRLRMSLVDARNGRLFAIAAIPFVKG